jgi:SAM-dependent methyltransferase
VDRGGSLRLWDACLNHPANIADYFHHFADIVGVDIDLSRAEVGTAWVADLICGDAYTEDMAARLGDFDIIIDDGPHTPESMLAVIRLYLPRLRPGGLMVIEDIQHPSWINVLASGVPEGFPIDWIDLRHVKGRYDDYLLVIRNPT